MITNILFALGGGIAGFLVCAFFTAGKLADNAERDEFFTFSRIADNAERDAALFDELDSWSSTAADLQAAHKRCADSQSIALEKLRAIREIANKPQAIRKGDIRAVLGDVA